MFHTSDNTPLHLVFRADVRLPHIPVEGAGFQQLLMRTLCVDGSILHHNDVICANNGRQPVCDHNQVLPTVKVEMAFCTSASFSGSI